MIFSITMKDSLNLSPSQHCPPKVTSVTKDSFRLLVPCVKEAHLGHSVAPASFPQQGLVVLLPLLSGTVECSVERLWQIAFAHVALGGH